MCKPLLPLCSIPPVADRDGDSGAGAKFYLPFYGYWTVSGEVLTWPSQEVAQDKTMRLGGVSSPDSFQKDCCTCSPCGDGFINIRQTYPR